MAQPVYRDLRPAADWTEDGQNHVLRVHLPGFKREQLRVQLDNLERVTVRGSRPLGADSYERVEQSFQLPNYSDAGKISGRFEEGYLYLVIPKRVVPQPQEKIMPPPTDSVRKEEQQKEMPRGVERKEEELKEKKEEESKPYPLEKPKGVSREEEEGHKNKPRAAEKKEEENQQKQRVIERKEEAAEKPLNKQNGEEDNNQKEKPKSMEETKASKPINGNGIKSKEQHPAAQDVAEKLKHNGRMIHDDVPEEAQKTSVSWKERIEEMEDWLSFGSMDGVWEAINRNKKLIAVAVLAFSAGFYVSRKLKTRA